MGAQADAQREQIITAAHEILSTAGMRALSPKSVSEKTGVSRPLLYHYFGGIEPIVDILVGRYTQAFSDQVLDWLQANAPLGKRLDPTESALFHKDLARLLRKELIDGSPLLVGYEGVESPPCYNRFLQGCIRALAANIAQVRGPVPHPDDLERRLAILIPGAVFAIRSDPQVTDTEIATAYTPLLASFFVQDHVSDGVFGFAQDASKDGTPAKEDHSTPKGSAGTDAQTRTGWASSLFDRLFGSRQHGSAVTTGPTTDEPVDGDRCDPKSDG